MIDYAQFYDREMDQRNQLRSAIATPLGLISLLGALVGVMVRSYRFTPDVMSIVFGSLLAAACCLIAGAIYYLVRSYHGHTYKGIQTALELKEYRDKLALWYPTVGGQSANADPDTENYLADSYARAAHHNAEVNMAKWDYLFLANRRLIYALIAVALALAPYLRDQLNTEQTSVQIIDFTPDLKKAVTSYGRQTRAQANTSGRSAVTSTPTGPTSKANAAAAKGSSRRQHPW